MPRAPGHHRRRRHGPRRASPALARPSGGGSGGGVGVEVGNGGGGEGHGRRAGHGAPLEQAVLVRGEKRQPFEQLGLLALRVPARVLETEILHPLLDLREPKEVGVDAVAPLLWSHGCEQGCDDLRGVGIDSLLDEPADQALEHGQIQHGPVVTIHNRYCGCGGSCAHNRHLPVGPSHPRPLSGRGRRSTTTDFAKVAVGDWHGVGLRLHGHPFCDRRPRQWQRPRRRRRRGSVGREPDLRGLHGAEEALVYEPLEFAP
mmetsp:Transcript_67161/g.189947  ORF Transcript_67161/g.189947 Transcript_67161/m.189947 type:complete len:259 (-) Transcript_67161:598-1374(-)